MSHSIALPRALRIGFAALLAAALCLAAGPGTAADAPDKGGAVAAKKSPPTRPLPSVASPAPTPAPSADEPAADEPAADEPAADEPDERAPGHRHSHMQIDDFDSFRQAMDVAPWIVGVVFLVLGSIFLTPIVILVGIIWYKLRKTRLQNDAVLKLAEKGVMPSAQAVDTVMAGTAPAQAAAVAAALPQAVATRRRAVWSDLRKGVLLGAIGLAMSLYSVTSGEANWLGLVLLFVGVAYIALWWLEDRHLERRVPGGNQGNGKD
jgi:hypothetical protein